jgi:transposase
MRKVSSVGAAAKLAIVPGLRSELVHAYFERREKGVTHPWLYSLYLSLHLA